MNRLNTVGAVYLLFVALIPTVLIMALGLNAKLPFGGTTILIIAGVGLDTLRQAKAQTEQFQYTGFLFETWTTKRADARLAAVARNGQAAARGVEQSSGLFHDGAIFLPHITQWLP